MNSAAVDGKPIVIAHRGASGYLPEHTLAAKALAHAMGADFIEQDVVMTADGVAVVLHDIYLEATTDVALRFPDRARPDGRYYAIDFSLSELRQLRLRERCSGSGKNTGAAVFPDRFPADLALFQLPTLAEEIDLIAGLDHSRRRRTGLYIELKSPNWHRREGVDIAAAVLEVLAQKGYEQRRDQVYLQCFDDATLRHIRHSLRSPLPLIQLLGENDWAEDTQADYEYLQSAEGLDDIASYADGIGPHLGQIFLGLDGEGSPLLSGLAAAAHDRNLLVHPYTFRADLLPAGITNFQQLLDIFIGRAGVDGLFTDFPDLVSHYLEQN